MALLTPKRENKSATTTQMKFTLEPTADRCIPFRFAFFRPPNWLTPLSFFETSGIPSFARTARTAGAVRAVMSSCLPTNPSIFSIPSFARTARTASTARKGDPKKERKDLYHFSSSSDSKKKSPSVSYPGESPKKVTWTPRKKVSVVFTKPNKPIKEPILLTKNIRVESTFLVNKWINLLMVAGKKSVAYKVFYAAVYEFLRLIDPGKPNSFLTFSLAKQSTPLGSIESSSSAGPKNSKIAKERKPLLGPSFSLGSNEVKDRKLLLTSLGSQGKVGKRFVKSKNLNKIQKRKNARIITKASSGAKKIKILNRNRFLLKLHTVIENVLPSVEGRKCRVRGSIKLVPAIVPYMRGCSLAMRWIIESARKRKKTSKFPMSHCLAQEFLDAYQKQGRPRQRRSELHKMCEGNRSFLRYRWW